MEFRSIVRGLSPRRWAQATVLGLALTQVAWSSPGERAYLRSVDLVQRLFLYPDTVDAPKLLGYAARGVSDEIHWLMVDTNGPTVRLSHGDGTEIGTVTATTTEELPTHLRQLETLVYESGYPIPDGVDVRLEILKGLTDGLDRYSRVLAGDRLARFDVRLRGTLVGIGATLSRTPENGLQIVEIIKGGPAERAGILAGDYLVRIDGESTINMERREASQRLWGDVDSPVVLTVKREGTDLELRVVRKEVVVPNVTHRVLDGAIGYVRISHISQRTVSNLKAALSELSDLGALSSGLVLDLRGNTGGSMKEAARSADEFVKEGMLLRTAGPDGGRVQNLQARMDAEDAETEPDIPIAVLMDERTASGAEILAGALFGLDRAVLIGTRSYGKGTVQKIYNLDDDTRLKLTVAQYLLADDRVIASVGLVPDAVLGHIELDAYGVRYRGWDVGRLSTPWEEIIPIVDEGEGWRGQAEEPGDLALEIARRTVGLARDAKRESALDALRTVTAQVRIQQEGQLVSALEHHGVNWSPAPEEGTFMTADVKLDSKMHPDRADLVDFEVHVTNNGPDPIARSLVELTCDSLSSWDGVVIPVGWVGPGETVTGSVAVPLRPGVEAREDLVTVRLRADKRPPLLIGDEVVSARSTPIPNLRLVAELTGEGETRLAQVTATNLAGHPISGVELFFGHPGDIDVELVDRASRAAVLAPRSDTRFDLSMEVGEGAPEVLPLSVITEAERFGTLTRWPLDLPLDGTSVTLEAPRVAARNHRLAAPIGKHSFPLVVNDDRALDHVVVYANGRKVAWAGGGKGRVELRADFELWTGVNRVTVVAEDDQGLRTIRRFMVRGEAVETVDAEEEP